MKLDPKVASKNTASAAKILNYVCLDNLNKQMIAVLRSVVKHCMPTASLLTESAEHDEGTLNLTNSIAIAEGNNSRGSTQNPKKKRPKTSLTNYSTL